MRLHLDRDRDEPLLWEETVRLDPGELGQDLLLAIEPIEVRGRVDLIDPEFRVAMDLAYRQELACTRCLRAVPAAVETHAELLVATRPEDPRGSRGRGARARDRGSEPQSKEHRGGTHPEDMELGKDDLGLLVVDGEHLDTEPLIAEQVLLEVPMKPLCAPDCRGLCPRCGADRNLTPDCCPETGTDERWEALGTLRERLSAEGR